MKPLTLIPQYFGSLVYDRRTSRYLPFDHESTQYLRNGIQTDSPFARHFQREGFWDLQGRFDGDILDLEPPADHLTGPLNVHLEVAARCNLSCKHCFAGSLPRAEPALNLEELDRFFQELVSLGCFRLGVTGGEPLMRRDLLAVLDAATARGLQPSLTTNSLLLTEEMARQLGRRPLVWLNVSLDGGNEASNDAIRGPGTFQRVKKKLELLGRHAAFSLAFTLTSQNAGEVEECCRLAEEVGASAAVFRPLYPVGQARSHPELMPSYAQYTRALQDLLGPGRFSTAHQTTNCGAGRLLCSVSVGGAVNPCSYLGSAHAADPWQEEFKRLGGLAPNTNWEV